MEKSYTKSKKERNPQTRFKESLSCLKKEEGYMTFLACMLFLVISALLFVCLDGSLVYQGQARAAMAQTGLSEHLLANYNVPLSKRYHLYFLDPRMNPETLEEKGKEYYEELFGASSGGHLFSSPVWKLKTEYLKVQPFGTVKEKEYEFFITQIEDYMKLDLAKDLLMKALGDAVQETENKTTDIEETVNKLDKTGAQANGSTGDGTLSPSEVAQGEQAGSEVQENNPLQKIRSILNYGVLGMVTDESKLSERELAPSLLPFKNQKENKLTLSMDIFKSLDDLSTLIKDQGLDQLAEGLSSQGALNLYIEKHFNYYNKSPVIKDTELLYEIEYILGGRTKDKENLEYVVNRLALLRFAFNASYAFANEELRAQALSLAALLTGVTGTPELIEPVRYIVLAAVSFIEAVTDVDALLEGEKVPIIKTPADWKTSINGTAKSVVGSPAKGFNYQEYTLILLTLQTDLDKKCQRMMNLMEINIGKEEPGFKIQECRAGISIKTGVKVKPAFYLKEYLLENELKIQY